jgi:hypothetical protein
MSVDRESMRAATAWCASLAAADASEGPERV